MQNSELLDSILQYARDICNTTGCSSPTRDILLAAALKFVCRGKLSGFNNDTEEQECVKRVLSGIPSDDKALQPIIDSWSAKQVPLSERIMLATVKNKAAIAAKEAQKQMLTADIFLAELLKEETPAIRSLRESRTGEMSEPEKPEEKPAPGPGPDNLHLLEQIMQEVKASKGASSESGKDKSQPKKTEPKEDEDDEDDGAEEAVQAEEPGSIVEIVEKAKRLQTGLQDIVFGQQHAVSTFVSGYFQAELKASIEQGRKRPRATFLFAGPPGVGKTFLSEEASRILGLPYQRFDMSEYTDPAAPNKLAGSDKNYAGSKEGLLTEFVKDNPRCILLFDEIEKARLEVIHQFLQILDAGRLRDNRTDEEIDFKDTILIFTTNAGKKLYNGANASNLSSLSRAVILDALEKDINPATHEPSFPAAICSRFASGNVVMFDHLDAGSLQNIVVKQLERHTKDLAAGMKINMELDEDISTALLLAEGVAADGRTVKSRADAFFGGELYELFRLITAKTADGAAENVKKINVMIDLDSSPDEIRHLFRPSERIQAMAYTENEFVLGDDSVDMPLIHYVKTADEAKKLVGEESIQLAFVDLFSSGTGCEEHVLNHEDFVTPARAFLHDMLERYPEVPVVLVESAHGSFTEEEKVSYLERGVKGFLSIDGGDVAAGFKKYADRIFRQNVMTQLARSNRLMSYETAQRLNPNGTSADIVVYDMKLEKAVKSEDAGNVLSMLSTPDVSFDAIIGADDAKDELKFFVSYMKSPKKYRREGVGAPKGVLLYGPPGTGKTMLAKAFAKESGATFIAAEGNQFFKKYVGEGPELVHTLFATARRYAPAVLFIDEIDTIAKQRSGDSSTSSQIMEEILTALFAEMDGFSTDANKPVFVLGATNYGVDEDSPMRIDPAMLRRFDRKIYIGLPDKEGRKKYLMMQRSKKPIFAISDDCIDTFADRTADMSLALISAVLDLSIRLVMQKGLEKVTDEVLEEALETYNSGKAKKWDAETTLRTARHEAGHALISWLDGEKPSYITIISRGNYGGYTQYGNQEERMLYTRQELLNRIRMSLGGRAAEIVYYGAEDGVSTGASGDLVSATRLARRMLCSYGMNENFGLAVADPDNSAISQDVRDEVNRVLAREMENAVRLIGENRTKIDAMVDKLLVKNSLKESEIDEVFANA